MSVAGHSSCRATTVVTAVGGGWKLLNFCVAASICLNFTKPKPPTITMTTANIKSMRLNMIPLVCMNMG